MRKYKLLNDKQKQGLRHSTKRWAEKNAINFIRNRFVCAKPRIAGGISLQYLLDLYNLQNGLCAISNIRMTHIIGDHASISIDRINSDEGYVPGNVQLVCQFINLGKNKHSNNEMREFIYELKQQCSM